MLTRLRFGGSLAALVDGASDKLAEGGLLVVLALVKAWNVYTDRRTHKSAGRRSSDKDIAQLQKSIAHMATIIAEVTRGQVRLADRVADLERRAK